MTRRSRLRSRLVVLFALGSTILLELTGALLYIGFNNQLENGLDQALRDRAAEITFDLQEGKFEIRPGEPFAAILEPSGRVIDATVISARRNPVLPPRELARARQGEVIVNRRAVTGLGEPARILAEPEHAQDGRNVIVVVGESLDTVIRARERLGALLGFTSPLLIGVIALCGWVLAGAALRPVRRLTEEADAISLREGGQRLRQPPGDDEIAHLGRTLNAMLGRIEASLAHERAFVDDASHELRTPISILQGELELALDQPGDQEEVERAIASALQEAERLGRLTEDLLVLARADRGHLAARAEPVDLALVAGRVAHRHGAGVEVAVDGEATAAADQGAVERILDNLLANACRHAAARAVVRIEAGGGWARLTVSDDGRGFPPEFVPVAFDRFSRADADRSRDHGGSGLGLAIVAALVRAHGGQVEIGADGALGGGRVTVTLPAAAPLIVSSSA